MPDGSRQPQEMRAHGPGSSEQVMTEHPQQADEEKPRQSSRDGEVSQPDTASARSTTFVGSVFRRPLLLIVAAVVCSVVAVVGVHYYQYLVTHVSTDDAFLEGRIIPISPQVAGHVIQVHVTDNQEIKQGDLLLEIDRRDYAARLEQARAVLQAAVAKQQAAQNSVELMSATSEASIQQATAGVELAKSVVQTARAQVITARSRLEQARAQIETAQANAAQAHAQVTAAQAEATRADADVKRARELYGSDQIVSRQDLEHANKDARIAEAQLEAARKRALAADAQVTEARAAQQTAVEQLHYVESQVIEARARVDEALGRLAAANAAPHQMAVSRAQADTVSAEVAQARAAVERAEIDVASTKIYAPESGRVTRKVVEAGAYVQVGQVLLTIVPRDLWVVANFMETQLTDMHPGQPVEIQVDVYPDRVFKGHVESIQSGTGSRFSLLPPENATGNFVKVVQRVPVKIVFDTPPDPAYLLSPGMSVVPVVHLLQPDEHP
jgi:membrane fusion protein (multidrug efflux system)